jgi:hypothetical protein
VKRAICDLTSIIDPLAFTIRRAAADIVTVANGQLMIGRTRRKRPRVTELTIMGARVSRAVSLGDPSFPAASKTGTFIAMFTWQPLSGEWAEPAEIGETPPSGSVNRSM